MPRLDRCVTLLSLALGLTLWLGPAGAQQIKQFAVERIETFDHDENFLGEEDVGQIAPAAVPVLAQKIGMLQVRLNGKDVWIYESDVVLTGKKAVTECQASLTRAADSQTAAGMGLGKCR